MFPFVLSQQQQLGRKDRILQQQKLEEAQQRAQEGSLGRVDERAFTNSEVRQKPGSQRRLQVKPVSCCIMGLKQNDTGYI